MFGKRLIFLLSAIATIAVATASAQKAESINGTYVTHNGDTKVLVYSSGDLTQGKAIWNKKYGNLSEDNVRVLQNLQYDSEKGFWNGRIYDPLDNRSYNVRVSKMNNGSLQLVASSGPFSKKMIWTADN